MTTMTSTRRGRILTITGGVVLCLTLTVALIALLSSEVDATTTEQPEVEVTRVVVDIDAGAITVVPADELRITVERRASRFAATPSSATEVTDGVLLVTGSCSWSGLGSCRTPVTIAVPPGTALDLATEAGPIRGEIVRGDLEATTAAGPIDLTVTGEVTRLVATTQAGPIDLVVPDDVYDVDAGTTVGRTRVEVDTTDSASRTIRARSEVGPVTIRTGDGDLGEGK